MHVTILNTTLPVVSSLTYYLPNDSITQISVKTKPLESSTFLQLFNKKKHYLFYN